jgi:hypothetical protein
VYYYLLIKMNTYYSLICVFLISGITLHGQEKKDTGFIPSTQPVFKLDYPSPTADKPQSKLWCGDGCWWAILPRSTGPSLWQRTNNGWKEHINVGESLKGIPGRADVWYDEGKVTAISVGDNKLVVFRLIKESIEEEWNWKVRILARLFIPPGIGMIETATIVQDTNGEWWVAADMNGAIFVWNSFSDGEIWTHPVKLADGLSTDDICTVSVLPGGVGVIWSDQESETVNIRIHTNGLKVCEWGETEIIESGNHTADDHLNTAMSADGTLWLVSKTSLDTQGKPLLVLRVRLADGRWNNYPYADLGIIHHPSRPIIVSSKDDKIILAGHTLYNSQEPALGEIVFGQIDTSRSEVLLDITPVIKPDTTGWGNRNRINNPTGPKKPFPKNGPWIILASDGDGHIFEADLFKFFDDHF